jgi:hypothetical protein
MGPGSPLNHTLAARKCIWASSRGNSSLWRIFPNLIVFSLWRAEGFVVSGRTVEAYQSGFRLASEALLK